MTGYTSIINKIEHFLIKIYSPNLKQIKINTY